jgi:hypothetical protein
MNTLTIPLGSINPNLLHDHLIKTVEGFHTVAEDWTGLPAVKGDNGTITHDAVNIVIGYGRGISEGAILTAISAFQGV